MKNKVLISVLVVGTIFVSILVLIFISAEKGQKRTCQFIIEQTLVFAINTKGVRLETSLDSKWKEFDSIQRQQLLDFAKKNAPQDTECRDYPYLIKGEDSDGTELSILARKNNEGRIEIQLGK